MDGAACRQDESGHVLKGSQGVSRSSSGFLGAEHGSRGGARGPRLPVCSFGSPRGPNPGLRPADARCGLRGTGGSEHRSPGQAVAGPREAPADVTRRLGSSAAPVPGTRGRGGTWRGRGQGSEGQSIRSLGQPRGSSWHSVSRPSAAWCAAWGEQCVPRTVVLRIVLCTAPATWWRHSYRALSRSFPAGFPSLFI